MIRDASDGGAPSPGTGGFCDNESGRAGGTAPAGKEGDPVKLGLVTYNVGRDWDVPTIIERLGAAGFEAVELRSTHRHGVEPGIEAAAAEKVRRAFEESPVRLLSLGSACEFHSPDAEERRANVRETARFVELAHDLGCWGVKVRPNGLPEDVPRAVTTGRIAEALRACGDHARGYGVEIWVEVHGRGTQRPEVMREIMDRCGHPSVGICWNSNPTDIRDGSIRQSFELLRPFVRNVHIRDLPDYPHRELFRLLRAAGYDRYTLAETAQSCEPERYLRYYSALWRELARTP